MSDAAAPPADAAHFLTGGGAMGAAMRGHDWAATRLGPPDRWPQALRTAVGIMLSSKFPMFIAWGDELTFLYNDGYREILGDKHPALGKPFADIWSEIWSEISPIVDRALAGEATFWEDLPLTIVRHGHPEQACFTFSYSALRVEDGEVRGMFCVVTETTRAVAAQRHRTTEVERLRRLLDRTPSFMAVIAGPDLRFFLANRAYLDSIGEDDVVGKSFGEVFPEAEYPGAAAPIEQVIRTGESQAAQGVPVTLPARRGRPARELVIDYVIQPIVENGQTLGVFISGNDVTARHLAERQLRESEERFRLIADSAPVPMWVSNPDRTRSFVNRAYVEFVGLDYEAASRLDWRTILHPDDHDRIVRESIAGEASLKPFTLEARYRGRDGNWRWIRSTSQPRWGPDYAVNGFIGVAHDVTAAKEAEAALRELNETLERRVEERTADLQAALERLQQEVADRERAEEALRQSQKMEAVGQLTGGIAHDFNNLLTPIIGGLELITRRIDDERLKRIAQAALESGQRGAKLATQLLAFSRLQRITMAPVAVNRVIEEMGRILHHSIGPRIEIEYELSDQVGHALCDANQLENAVLNLAINARDAMPDGGCLAISTGLHDEPQGPDLAGGTYVCISVRDNGHGMAPDVLARALEPFFSTKPVGKGTGLGLAQVYGIAQQSGGTVRIDSQIGAGTKVHLLLPRVQPADPARAAEPAGPEHVPGPGTRAEILVVDDDPDVRSFLTHALVELGHQVVACDCAEAGLEQLARGRPDLALIDFAMPGMNGAQLATAAKQLHPQLRIAFVTGYAETGQLEAAVGPDAAVLRKPFTIDQLAEIIERQLA